MLRNFFTFFAIVTIAAWVICVASVPSPAVANSKYAALVVDADNGTVLYTANANARRYPASLTKLMTLYLTFDALKKKRLSLDSRLKVSARAASMPQTNIGLKKGDRIKVRDIIRSLVVRSANDSAVVIAEALGKSEAKFAKMMTAQARRLGMKNTVFRNASGLPDRKQYTTARDIIILALALKNHFPQYFHFFRTSTFRYKGKTYKSHNKVMKRYPGVDGMKTGYIRASGFNLVTSARRNGRSIIAVVMGGKTSKRRDNHMISLLDRSFAKLKKMGGFAQAKQSKNIPVPHPKPKILTAGYKTTKPATKTTGKARVIKVARTEIAGSAGNMKNTTARSIVKNTKNTKSLRKTMTTTAATSERAARTSAKTISVASLTPPAAALYKDWGIQVGAFDNRKSAYDALQRAIGIAQKELSHSRAAISDAPGDKIGQVVYRARLANLTEEQARRACRELLSSRSSCFIFRIRNASDL